MPKRATHEECTCALLLIDVINDLEFDGGATLLKRALPMAKKLARLVERARAAEVPIVYVNDNFGHWRSDFRALVRHCTDDDVRGRPIARLLMPAADDYFILKPRHSAFYGTALETLLHVLQAKTLVLTGLAGDNCVLFTAHDAYMREYQLVVPSDCIASESVESNRWALKHMKTFLKADTRPSSRVSFEELLNRPAKKRMQAGVTRRARGK